MDTIILAAGRNKRLAGIAKPTFKPLLPYGEETIIGRLVRQSLRYSSHIIIVCSCDNVQAISNALTSHEHRAELEKARISYVIQTKPAGPGDALNVGMQCTNMSDDRVLILMGDNVLTDDDMEACITHSKNALSSMSVTPVVGVRHVTTEEAVQYTVFNRSMRLWEEKVPITDEHIDSNSGTCMVWCGPIVTRASKVDTALYTSRSHMKKYGDQDQERYIGKILSVMTDGIDGIRDTRQVITEFVETTTVDVGTPDYWHKNEPPNEYGIEYSKYIHHTQH